MSKITDEDFYSYWNDEEIEQQKIWNVVDKSSFEKMRQYLLSEKCGLGTDLEYILNKFPINNDSFGISLGAGVCWESGFFYKHGVEKMDFLDYSLHRIDKIAPKVFEYYGINDYNYRRMFGSYYDVQCSDETYDFCFMSMALMMSENPQKLIAECYRILKPTGKILIIGEPKIKASNYLYYLFIQLYKSLEALFKTERCVNIDTIFSAIREGLKNKPDISGAHKHLLLWYLALFHRFDFKLLCILKNNEASSVCVRNI